ATISCRLRRSFGAVAVSCTDGGREFRSCMEDCSGKEERENSSVMMLIPAIRRQPAMDLLGSAPQQGRDAVAPGSTTHHSSAPLRIVVMEGDGIGPEITAATMAVLGAAGRVFKLGLSFTPVAIGLAALRAQGTTLPPAAVDAAKAADGV